MSLGLMQDVVFEEGPPSEGEPLAGDELFADLMQDAPAPSSGRQILTKGCNYSHDAMIDLIIANPGITQNEIAATFGYTPGWVSQVIRSDAFQAKLASRTHEIRDPIIIASIEDQFKGILARGLELTRQKLDQGDKVSDNFLLRTVDMSAKALGYGAKRDDSGRNEKVTEHLAELSGNLVQLLHQRKRQAITLEGETE